MSKIKAIAIVGIGVIMPDALDAPTFWQNIKQGRYSITEVPQDRWRVDLYYDPDPSVPDKTYSKIGAWVRGFKFEPFKLGIAIPPKVLAVMDEAQQWAIVASRQALDDYGYPKRPLNPERVAVIFGNSLGGEYHYRTTMRIYLPEYLDMLASLPDFQNLPREVQTALVNGMQEQMRLRVSDITEDTMPGELSNIIAGRVANVFNFAGPNFVTDAACASSIAALQNAVEGLIDHRFDAALTGGIDRGMGPEAFVKFSKIGALSPDGSRPFADGANGFVMGEGAAVFLLKRLEDAEKDGDKVYAVIRGVGGSSDGKGKGITAPNPLGQQRAIERAWRDAGLSPATAGLIEAHGTSTRVGDVTEVNSLNAVFAPLGLPVGRVALGSVKSNIGHLKSAAGAAGLLKAVYALYEHVIPPSVNFERPNPNIDFAHLPFYVPTETRPWEVRQGEVRRAGVSSFGFGGTNFHVVLEEYVPGMLRGEKVYAVPEIPAKAEIVAEPVPQAVLSSEQQTLKPFNGLLFLSASSTAELMQSLRSVLERANRGELPASVCPNEEQLRKPQRLAIDFANADELLKRGEKAFKALENPTPGIWTALTAQGIFYGSGEPGKVAFMFPGQGSQYVNMLRELKEIEPVVAETFNEADRVMTPILGRTLTSYIFVDGDEAALAQAEKELRNTEITQPAMLTANVALLRVMQKYGFRPHMVIGHSLGEYAALVAAEVLTFAEALEVVSARGREMSKVSLDDNGAMVAVSAPLEEVEQVLKTVEGYAVIANINSPMQSVIGGSTAAMESALTIFQKAGFQASKIPVSHAFHTRIVAPASEPLRKVIQSKNIRPPKLPIVANVTGELYPTNREEIIEMLAQQLASPVQMVKSMQTLYREGARIFVEIGPKRVISALATDNLKNYTDILILGTNHPRKGALVSLNEALCGLYAAGVVPIFEQAAAAPALSLSTTPSKDAIVQKMPTVIHLEDGRLPLTGSVVISGAGLGLPGRNKAVFDERNVLRLLNGEMLIEPLTEEKRRSMLDKRVTRLVKSEAGAVMETIDDLEQTVKLAGQGGAFNLKEEFGIPEERVEATDISTQLAIAAGIDALRDAGIPLVMAYRQTSKGTLLPDRWRLPEALADETGVIFGSAFPGLDQMAVEAERYYGYQRLAAQLNELRGIEALLPESQQDVRALLAKRIAELEAQIAELDYHFDRRFIFRVLSMGHSQFAEHIGARGPNTHVNAACATTTHAIAIAEDWIRTGRCRRVIVIAGDDVTRDSLAGWIGTGLLASGAATTEGNPRMAILPFDRRRNGMIMGMGAAALVIESEDAVRERGMKGISEILSTVIANSAFHGTRLDVGHVCEVMERVVSVAEERYGIRRKEIAPQTVFVSHETYTPARGGSASAEIRALRYTFREAADQIIIANTKGYTGHSMGVGIEDVLAAKALEYGIVPPIANIHDGFEPDPELGNLNLSRGGKYDVQYALRLGAGFGSQIAMTLTRKIAGVGERVNPEVYQQWLADLAGYEHAETEVVQHTLRIKHTGAPVKTPKRSTWQYGQGPTKWALGDPKLASQPVQSVSDQPPAIETVEPKTQQPVAVEQPKPVAVSNEEIKNKVLALVSEKTGYPVEMLDLDLDLEADLGIDTVKQAELFASVRGLYDIPRREDLRLADYNTLAKVIAFVEEAVRAQGGGSVQAKAETPLEVPAAVQPQAVSSAASSPALREEIKEKVLALVSEKTGYPVEMLDLDLDLEADLGIDTVKQAELFASVRGLYDIPRREDLRLADYNTLAKVIAFVEEAIQPTRLPETGKMEEVEKVQPGPEESVEEVSIGLESKISQPSAQKSGVIRRRVPVPVLRPRLDLCLPTGVGLEESKRVLVVRDQGRVADALVRLLQKHKVNVFEASASDIVEEHIQQWQAGGNIDGVYFLPALDIEPELKDLTLEGWQEAMQQRVYALYTLMRGITGSPFLVCATRLSGLHGYGPQGATAPMGGAVSGFAKALARERPNTLVKVVDFSSDVAAKTIASRLLEETLSDPAVVEVGYEGDLRFTIVLRDQPLPEMVNFDLKPGSVFLVSGGTAGIIAPVLLDLAQIERSTFYLLGRSPLPESSDPDILQLKADREAFRKALLQRMAQQAGGRPAFVEVEQKLAALERAASTLETMAEIRRCGGKVEYLVCDVTDFSAVRAAVQRVIQQEGRLDVLIHAAGFERSRKLESKPSEEVRQTLQVKADGFFHLYKALLEAQVQPGAIVLFSSVAGRFGNAGQVDYSAANDLLSKIASAMRRQNPAVKTLVLDWGAWAEVGMASRGHVPELMKMAGIEMIPPAEGAPCVRKELMAGNGEVVLAGSLGVLEAPACPNAGINLMRANTALREGKAAHKMLSQLTDLTLQDGILLEAELDPNSESFLRDHALNGIPVLPGVVGIEGFVVAARHIASVLASPKQGFTVSRLENIQFLLPFKFYRNQARRVMWKAQMVREASGLVAYVTLESDLPLHSGRVEHMVHFSGMVHMELGKEIPAPTINPPQWKDKTLVGTEDIYRLYFHGPTFQILEGVQTNGEGILGRMRNGHAVVENGSPLAGPAMLVELCFQTAGIWEAAKMGVLALPRSIGSLTFYRACAKDVPVYAEVIPQSDETGNLRFDARVVDAHGCIYLELKDYRTSPLPYAPEKELLEPFKRLTGGVN